VNTSPPKLLQLFFDGTANSAAEGRWADATNVFRMVLALHYEGNQIVFYMPGVGTRGDWLSTVTARGMDEIVREAYVNLASNCLPHDQIYIFGFSRGGAAAFALTEIISKVGLLWADDLDELHTVWDYYVGSHGGKPLTDADRTEMLDRRLREKVRKPEIRFLGLFDPVPGNAWDTLAQFSKIRPTSPQPPSNVNAAVNILSIDDNRNPSYSPVLLNGTATKTLEQIWMPGVHADIGGNSDAVFLSDVALLTMIERAKRYCPELIWDNNYISYREQQLGEHVSVTVTDERFDLKRKLLGKADRIISEAAMLHPVFDCLNGKEFWVRSKWQRYMPSHVPPSMTRLASNYTQLFEAGCEQA
jgi:uncharacterized protein (DUF2235 family)